MADVDECLYILFGIVLFTSPRIQCLARNSLTGSLANSCIRYIRAYRSSYNHRSILHKQAKEGMT